MTSKTKNLAVWPDVDLSHGDDGKIIFTSYIPEFDKTATGKIFVKRGSQTEAMPYDKAMRSINQLLTKQRSQR